ncbi:MAG: MFS transporter [Actinobacteria bacterium]|nr:MFS transporter [Actinomycetota bacterium]
MMGASQCLFVTFGAWLTDDYGFDATGIAAVGFALGAGELFASISSARLTDRIGKERSVMLGALVMAPCAALLAGFNGSLVIGLAALAVFIIGFEYGVVSLIPVATDLYAGAPGKGFGLVIGAGTFGRGVLTVIATGLYDETGVVGACVAAVVCAALSASSIAVFAARRRPSKGVATNRVITMAPIVPARSIRKADPIHVTKISLSSGQNDVSLGCGNRSCSLVSYSSNSKSKQNYRNQRAPHNQVACKVASWFCSVGCRREYRSLLSPRRKVGGAGSCY